MTTTQRPEGAFPAAPRTLAAEPAVKAREQLLAWPHHVPLAAYVLRLRERLRERGLDVPHFDPLGGGLQARVLYLLEAPGPKAARTHRGSGFVSLEPRRTFYRSRATRNEAVFLKRLEWQECALSLHSSAMSRFVEAVAEARNLARF